MLRLWPCGEQTLVVHHANTRYNSIPWWWYGTPINAQVHLDPFTKGYLAGSIPFFLSLSFIYLSSTCLMLTLGIISNNVNVKQNHEDLNHRTGLCRWHCWLSVVGISLVIAICIRAYMTHLCHCACVNMKQTIYVFRWLWVWVILCITVCF